MRNAFVNAEWTDLLMLNYAVPDEALAPYLGDLEIDRWNGSAIVSVVGLHFGTSRLVGVDPVLPCIRSFAQWNLRAYVRHPNGNGIVFLKEYVPSTLVTTAVRLIYRENYHTARIDEHHTADGDRRGVRYSMDAGGRRHTMSAMSTSPAADPAPGTLEYFVAERYTGFPARHRNIHFCVEHRAWHTHKIASYLLDVDYRLLYGDHWAFLNDVSPAGIAWCDGSPVSVSWPTKG